MLGLCNLLQFQRSSELLHLDASISNFRKAAQQLSLKKQPEVLGILGITYLDRYRLRKETPDLDAAISNLRKATELQVENNEMQAWHFHQMGLAFHNRFKLYQELPDIDRAISHMRKATELHTESTRRIEAFLSLGILFLDRYNLRHLLPDSDASISNLQKAVEICPDNHHSRPVVFYWLGCSHYRRFHLLRRVPGVDSEAAVANLERAVASSQASNPEHATYVKALSEAKEGHSPSLGMFPESHLSVMIVE
jgi:tetratricopeptide (TPR) repeat protein